MSNRRAARWIVTLLGLALVVITGAYLFAPRRVARVASVDGGADWNAAVAPPRRTIVWGTAEAIVAVGLDLAPGDSVIRPQLADGGSTLFFTLRRAGGDANILRSRLIDGAWQAAVPVEAINSESEDIGPILTRDGSTLYLYSDRPGGYGGFDLFVSRRTKDAWSEPQNLGTRINSVADEYDPAVSPDGVRLYFSSNRSDQLQKRILTEGGVADAKDWPATLRAQSTAATFDLYLAERDDANSPWQVPRTLAELNRRDASEGTPIVSSNGAFLYFASDRPQRAGESPNFDIYRARIDGPRFGQAENLGSGVNSAANEMEPALSSEGFRLFFSRNADRPGEPANDQYALYASIATEVTEASTWDDANLSVSLSWILRNWASIVLTVLVCCVVAGLIWYLRQVSMKRATVPGFFLSALVIHLMLVGSLFVVALDDDLRNRLKKEVQELVVAVQLDDDPQPEESTPEYGNQADSQRVESVQPTDVQRQSVKAPPIETPSENPRPAPPVPSELPLVVPREQIATTQPELKMPTDAPTLERQRIDRDQPAEMVETIAVQPVEVAAEAEPTKLEVDLSRTRPIAELTASPKMQTLPNAPTPLRPTVVPVQQTSAQPATSATVAEAPALMRKAKLDVAMVETKVETAELAAEQQSNSPSPPARVAVDVMRQAARDTSTPIAGLPPRRTMLANTPAESIESVPVQRAGEQPLEVRSPSKPIPLARADRPAPSDAPTDAIPTEAVAGPITPLSIAEPAHAVIEVARQANQNTVDPTSGLPPRRESIIAPAFSGVNVTPNRSVVQPVAIASRVAPIALARADRPQPSDSTAEAVPTEAMASPVTSPPSAEPATTTIEVVRQANQNMVDSISGLLPRRETMMSKTPALTSTNLPAQQADDQPVEVARQAEPIILARVGRTDPQSNFPDEAVPTENMAGPVTPANHVAAIAAAQVDIARQENPNDLAPQTATAPTEANFSTPLAAAKIQPSPRAKEFVLANPADAPTTLAMLRRPAAAGIESTSEPIETIEQATGELGGETNVDPSQLLAVSVSRAGAASPAPRSLPAGLNNATADLQLTVDQNTMEVATLESTIEPRSAAVAASIARISAAMSRESIEPIATEEVAADAPAMAVSTTTGVAVAASLAEPQMVESIQSQIGANALPRSSETSQLAMATLIKDSLGDAPEFVRTASSLARKTNPSPSLRFAEDDIGLQAMLRLRQSEAKKDLLEAFGGNTNTEAAVERGLNWIELHQHDEGQWSLNRFTQLCDKHHKAHRCNGTGGASDTAATGFALLPFLGAGHTHQDGKHQEAISRGLKWLVENQKPDGDLFVGSGGNTHMYSHGIAAIALCEAYAMMRDPQLRAPAQKAIDFIVAAQHPTSGGWRYAPRQDGDTSVFGWQVMALKSGQMAELNVPNATLDKARKWLAFVGAKGANEGRFGYTNASPTLTMTAEALLCLQYLGGERNDPRLIAGSKFLAENLPTKETSYYWYYGTQVMFHMQGEPWRKWNAALQTSLVETQVKEGSMAGTWNPTDNWEKTGGRVYSTALRLLMLEVYYRHLPLYQVLDQ